MDVTGTTAIIDDCCDGGLTSPLHGVGETTRREDAFTEPYGLQRKGVPKFTALRGSRTTADDIDSDSSSPRTTKTVGFQEPARRDKHWG